MLNSVNPKLPMRSKTATKYYYLNQLGFTEFGATNYPEYLMIEKDNIQIHFFLFEALNPKENYGQIYIRTNDIEGLYESMLQNKIPIHPASPLTLMPWGHKEFALLDPDNNLLTFGQEI